MEDILNQILKTKLDESFTQKAAQGTNINSEKYKSLIEAAIPFVVASLAKNTNTPAGADQLEKTLTKNHDGSIFDKIDSVIQNPDQMDASKILQHLFGDKTADIENLLAQKTGVNINDAEGVLKILAPIVMGALGKAKQEQGVDASGLSRLLQISAKNLDGTKGLPMNMIIGFLDSDKDGKVSDDILNILFRMIKSFFSSRKK